MEQIRTAGRELTAERAGLRPPGPQPRHCHEQTAQTVLPEKICFCFTNKSLRGTLPPALAAPRPCCLGPSCWAQCGHSGQDRTRLGWRWGAGTRGLSPPLPHCPSASPSSSPSTPLQSSSLTSCTLSSRPLPLPLSLLRSQSWGGARPAVGQASMAGLSVPPLQFRSLGAPGCPAFWSLEGKAARSAGSAGSCFVEKRPAQPLSHPETGPVPTPGNPRASSRGMCGVPAGVPREWQVAAVAPLGPGPPRLLSPALGPLPQSQGHSSAPTLPGYRLFISSAPSLLPCANLCPRPKWPPAPPPFTCPSRPHCSPCDLS